MREDLIIIKLIDLKLLLGVTHYQPNKAKDSFSFVVGKFTIWHVVDRDGRGLYWQVAETENGYYVNHQGFTYDTLLETIFKALLELKQA